MTLRKNAYPATMLGWSKFDKTHAETRRETVEQRILVCLLCPSLSDNLCVCVCVFTMRESAQVCLRQWVGVCFWQVPEKGSSILKVGCVVGVQTCYLHTTDRRAIASQWYLVLPLVLPHSCCCNLTREDQGRHRVRTKRKRGPD